MILWRSYLKFLESVSLETNLVKIDRADLFDGSTVPASLRRSFRNDTDDSCEKEKTNQRK